MTEGIIQEVFKKYIGFKNSFLKSDLLSIQQELIEKIKQAEILSDRGIVIKSKTLIGDNQE